MIPRFCRIYEQEFAAPGGAVVGVVVALYAKTTTTYTSSTEIPSEPKLPGISSLVNFDFNFLLVSSKIGDIG